MNNLPFWSVTELTMSESHSSIFSNNCERIDTRVKCRLHMWHGDGCFIVMRGSSNTRLFYPSSFKSALDQNLQLTEASNRNINSSLSFNLHWKCSVRKTQVLNVLVRRGKANNRNGFSLCRNLFFFLFLPSGSKLSTNHILKSQLLKTKP